MSTSASVTSTHSFNIDHQWIKSVPTIAGRL